MRVLTGRNVRLRSLDFSPDGSRLAAGGDGGVVQVWDLRGGERVRRFQPPFAQARRVFWLGPDRLAAPTPFSVWVEDLADENNATQLFEGRVARLDLSTASPDRGAVCLAEVFGVSRHDVAASARAWKVEIDDLITALAWSAGGAVIGVGLQSGEVRLLDAATGAAVARCDDFGRAAVNSVALSPDGRTVASCAATHLHVRRPADRFEVHHTLGKTHFFEAAFHPSGRFFVTANGDGTIDVWDADTGARRDSLRWDAGKPLCVAFDAAGDRAACGTQTGAVVVWDVDG